MSVDRLFGLKIRLSEINSHPLDGTGDAWMDRQVLVEELKQEIRECQEAAADQSAATIGDQEKRISWWSQFWG